MKDADFIQESAPEREDLKRKLHAADHPRLQAGRDHRLLDLRPAAEPDSRRHGRTRTAAWSAIRSTRSICCRWSKWSAARRPRRTTDAAAKIYAAIGMHPLKLQHGDRRLRRRPPAGGGVARGLHMINEGVATTAEIDDAIRFGCGIRLSFMGTLPDLPLAGGDAGMRHFMAQFGPALKLPWTKLKAPELTDELIERMVEAADAAGRRPLDQRARALARRLPRRGHAGAARREHGRRGGARALRGEAVRAQPPHRHGRCRRPVAPLRLHETRVQPEWVDYNGHMTESRYLQVFGDSSDAFFRYIGIDDGVPRRRPQLLHRRDPHHPPARGRGRRAAARHDAAARASTTSGCTSSTSCTAARDEVAARHRRADAGPCRHAGRPGMRRPCPTSLARVQRHRRGPRRLPPAGDGRALRRPARS